MLDDDNFEPVLVVFLGFLLLIVAMLLIMEGKGL
jgi:hypothetical protein